jgi:hypothetical protein
MPNTISYVFLAISISAIVFVMWLVPACEEEPDSTPSKPQVFETQQLVEFDIDCTESLFQQYNKDQLDVLARAYMISTGDREEMDAHELRKEHSWSYTCFNEYGRKSFSRWVRKQCVEKTKVEREESEW